MSTVPLLMGIVLIALCAALVTVGVVTVVRWGAGVAAVSAADGVEHDRLPARRPLLWLARYGAVMTTAGILAGLLAAGAGGRLLMRLLALTSPEMHGTFTEGGAVVGDITVEGTISFVTFVGLSSGLLTGALYALTRPLLPPGRAGGLALGAILLVLTGPRVEPLRADNIDFALLGPDWLAVLLFALLALFQGMLVVALAGRLFGGVPPVHPRAGARRALAAGRLAATVLVLAALPGFVSAVADILTSA